MRIAVDFDGTLCNGDNFPEIGEPNIKVINWVKKQQAKGHKIILWTVRWDKLLQDAINWSREQGLEFDHVQLGKVGSDIYLDDKAMRVEDIDRFDAETFERG